MGEMISPLLLLFAIALFFVMLFYQSYKLMVISDYQLHLINGNDFIEKYKKSVNFFLGFAIFTATYCTLAVRSFGLIIFSIIPTGLDIYRSSQHSLIFTEPHFDNSIEKMKCKLLVNSLLYIINIIYAITILVLQNQEKGA